MEVEISFQEPENILGARVSLEGWGRGCQGEGQNLLEGSNATHRARAASSSCSACGHPLGLLLQPHCV